MVFVKIFTIYDEYIYIYIDIDIDIYIYRTVSRGPHDQQMGEACKSPKKRSPRDPQQAPKRHPRAQEIVCKTCWLFFIAFSIRIRIIFCMMSYHAEPRKSCSRVGGSSISVKSRYLPSTRISNQKCLIL